MIRNYLFISFGSIKNHRQNAFSILSLLHFEQNNNNFNIYIYTDDKEFFHTHINHPNIITLSLSKKKIKEFKGVHKYIFRIKISCILELLQQTKNKILYLDGDTFFTQSPATLFNNISYNNTCMYIKEGRLMDKTFKNWECIRLFIQSNSFINLNQDFFQIQLTHYMWNAGVIGVSYENIKLVQEVLFATDQYCSKVKENKYHQDQLMFSYFFQTYTQLHHAKDYIHHYCYNYEKENFNVILKSFFKTNRNTILQQAINKAYVLTLKPIPNTPIQPGIFMQLSILLKRIQTSLLLRTQKVLQTKNTLTFFNKN